ncbi:MAG TPA: LolA-related protein [Burkholderiales bacterium]|nr:LolA-related protein [Burkholderiales bacterium]
MLPALVIVLAFCAGTHVAGREPGAQQNAAGWDVQQLMRELGAVKRSQARFVERKYLKVLKAPLELRGTLTYVAPGNLEKRTLSPKPETLMIDGDLLTIESAARNERRTLRLQDYPVLWAFVESIRSTLSGDIAALERFYRVELEGNRARWRLYLVPRDAEMRAVINLINISGSRDKLERIEVQEAKGDRSVTTIVEESR